MTDDLKALAARVLSRNRAQNTQVAQLHPIGNATMQLSGKAVQPACNTVATAVHNLPDSLGLSGNLSGNSGATTELHRGATQTPLMQPVCNSVAGSVAAIESAPESDQERLLERAAIIEHDGELPRDEADRLAGLRGLPTSEPTTARAVVRRHPCPPLPSNYRWRDSSPLADGEADPDDTRIRCAYCRHWKPVTRHGRLKPWCLVKDDWEEPSILHHCTVDRFEFDPAQNWRRWMLTDGDGSAGERP